jgi:hypothetical protein
MRKLELTPEELEAREIERKSIYGVRQQVPKRQLDNVQKLQARIRQCEYVDRQRGLRRPDRRSLAQMLLVAVAQSTKAELKAAAPILLRAERLSLSAGYDPDQTSRVLRELQSRLKRL